MLKQIKSNIKKLLAAGIFSAILITSLQTSYALTPRYVNGDYDNNDTNTCVTISYNLKYRSKDSNTGGDVSELQAFLQDKGYLNSEPTGFFGRGTENAVKSYQASKNLSGTGYVGSFTRTAIKNDTCGTVPTPTPVNYCATNTSIWWDPRGRCVCPAGSVEGEDPVVSIYPTGTRYFRCNTSMPTPTPVLKDYDISMTFYSNNLNKYLTKNSSGYFDATDVDGNVNIQIDTRKPRGCDSQYCATSLPEQVDVLCTIESKTEYGNYNFISASKNFTQSYNKNGLGLDFYRVSCGDGVNYKKIVTEFIVETKSPTQNPSPINNYCIVGQNNVSGYYKCVCPPGTNEINTSNMWSGVYTFECSYGYVALKPIIYLYPTSTTDVSVKLDYKGKVFVSYPEMGNGWNVTAKTDGTLTDKADGKEYSYLFWEGKPSEKPKYDMSTGFVVKGSDAREFLQDKLKTLGLTAKEYNEFIVYWYPKMQENKYNLVHFATKSEYDEKAVLTINPKPDSVLRVFMVVKPIKKEIKVTEQKLETFERKGFSVIEWGGMEIR